LPRIHICRLWWRTPTVVGVGTIESHGGVAGVVATVVFTVVVILATITIIAAVVVLVPVVVVIALAGSTVVVLARWARRHQGDNSGAGSMLFEQNVIGAIARSEVSRWISSRRR
jgi:hypothetical protein